MADTFPDRVPLSPDAPAIGSIPINFAADQTWTGNGKARGLHISTIGTLKVTWANGLVDTIVFPVAGLYPYAIVQVWQVGSSGVVGNILF